MRLVLMPPIIICVTQPLLLCIHLKKSTYSLHRHLFQPIHWSIAFCLRAMAKMIPEVPGTIMLLNISITAGVPTRRF
jgi:hypothetical protein